MADDTADRGRDLGPFRLRQTKSFGRGSAVKTGSASSHALSVCPSSRRSPRRTPSASARALSEPRRTLVGGVGFASVTLWVRSRFVVGTAISKPPAVATSGPRPPAATTELSSIQRCTMPFSLLVTGSVLVARVRAGSKPAAPPCSIAAYSVPRHAALVHGRRDDLVRHLHAKRAGDRRVVGRMV